MGRPREFDEERVTKAIRIPPELNAALKRLADERQVSVNLIVAWALQEFVDRAKSLDEIREAG